MTRPPLTEPAQPLWVSQHNELRAAHEACEPLSVLAMSVELLTRQRYRPQAALITLVGQGETGWVAVSIDTLASSLHPKILGTWLQALAERCTLWVHGAEHPMAVLRRDYGFQPPYLLDVQQGAGLLGWPQTGHQALVERLLGQVSQRVRALDWSSRPLPKEAWDASLTRTRELFALAPALTEAIAAAELQQEWALASRLVWEPHHPQLQRVDNVPDPRRYHRIEGARQLSRYEQAVLATLAEWRDLKARELDLDPPSLLTNAQLIELAHAPERGITKLREIRFHSKLLHSEREGLIALLQDIMRSGPELTPPREWVGPEPSPFKKGKPDRATVERLRALKAFRADEAERRQVGPAAILPALALEHLAFFPKTPLAEVPGLGTSRIARYGDALTRLLKPKG